MGDRYEIQGTFTREQAVQIAEALAGSSVLWHIGHTYPTADGKVVIRPAGCKCVNCSAQETVPAPTEHAIHGGRIMTLRECMEAEEAPTEPRGDSQ